MKIRIVRIRINRGLTVFPLTMVVFQLIEGAVCFSLTSWKNLTSRSGTNATATITGVPAQSTSRDSMSKKSHTNSNSSWNKNLKPNKPHSSLPFHIMFVLYRTSTLSNRSLSCFYVCILKEISKRMNTYHCFQKYNTFATLQRRMTD